MDTELPSDWRSCRRAAPPDPPASPAAAPEASSDTAAAAAPAAEGGALVVQPSKRRAHRSRSSQSKRARTASSSASAAPAAAVDGASIPEAPQQQHQAAAPNSWGVSALGPRSVFDAAVADVPERGQLRDMVIANLAREAGACIPPDEIEVDCLLCKLPYKKMLQDMFGSGTTLRAPQIQYVTRAYEESFMREPMHAGERKCPKGRMCECNFIDPEQPFVGVEFLMPGERPPPTPHMCVLCCRAVTQQLYYDVMFDKQDFGGVIQRFGNIHSQPGEYALDAMLIAAPSAPVHVMPLPIVSHQRNRYSVYIQGGIKYLKQSRVYFQDTPP